jgi:hypothetical protein
MATDMARHLTLVADLVKLVADNEFNAEEIPAHRLIFMQHLLKCADLSACVRQYDVAEKSRDYIGEEFFRQGEIDKVPGIVYDGSVKDRQHLDKKRSQIAFFAGVCLPTFEALVKIVPALELLLNQLKMNLDMWRKASKQ